ncbi:DUF998 domain-containing protein [Oceanobacillus neutriphilus]|uniref:DUF998 domain-containing protein n=1 Tax=Oceanobacillus neutriphilus TaxID=531815 RepID=A0ABQ2P296_9BACI|nr:DUF998 domain-containing protein [Oceanobacillus neutriphilus]GGP16477.1 hypothetical protein GCM10011346_48600 [Oceanobacillus neutriphilus]
MSYEFHAGAMIIVTLTAVLAIFLVCKTSNRLSVLIGLISWIALSAYFIIEAIVIRATAAPYSFLNQPMSDLGVTACGTDTYLLASYTICSPYHWLMNWTFFLTGLFILIGAVLLSPLWPKVRSAKIANILIGVFGVSYAISGIIPADIDFYWHTLTALPGMVVQIPAMILISIAIHKKMPRIFWWTIICTIVTTAALLSLFLQPVFTGLPGGLLQRILYASVYIWLTGTAIGLWSRRIHKAQQKGS